MTQLSLFDSPSASLAPVVPLAPLGSAPVASVVVGQPSRNERRAAVVEPPRSSLRRLAELIHEGNSRIRSERAREIQRLGDLAWDVLFRHDLMARRRHARRA